MQIISHRDFEKAVKKLTKPQQRRLKERLRLFASDPFDSVLNNHALKGKHKGYRSINITGDIRALYEPLKEDASLFVAIGTHSELYN